MSRFCVIRTWPSSFSKILGDSRQCVASSPLLENLVEQLKAKNQRLYVLLKTNVAITTVVLPQCKKFSYARLLSVKNLIQQYLNDFASN